MEYYVKNLNWINKTMILLWVQTVENDVINKMPLFNNKVGAISIDDIVFIFKRFTFYIIFTT